RCGRRSRELFEARFTAATMTANTLTYYADVVAGRYPRTHNTTGETRAARLSRMGREFAAVISEATGVPPDGALKMAQSFLCRHKNGLTVDYLTHVSHLLHRQPGKFVSGVYELLLGRAETPAELAEG